MNLIEYTEELLLLPALRSRERHGAFKELAERLRMCGFSYLAAESYCDSGVTKLRRPRLNTELFTVNTALTRVLTLPHSPTSPTPRGRTILTTLGDFA